jgi:hypothetical protein
VVTPGVFARNRPAASFSFPALRRITLVKSAFYDAVEDATRGEFHLISELGGADGWAAFLARGQEDGQLAVLLLQEADGGEFDLEILHEIDGGIPAGRTTCPACGTADEGWPRFCPACRADLSGLAPDEAVSGGGAAELLRQVREAAAGEYEVLGAVPHAEGGGALYFAREEQGGRVVGLALHVEEDDALALVASWAPSTATQPAAEPAPWEPEPFVAAPEAAAPLDAVSTGGAPSWLEAPRERAPTRRERERKQRLVAGAGVAVIATALVAALVLAFTGGPAAPEAGINPLSPDTGALVLPVLRDTAAESTGPGPTAGPAVEPDTDRRPARETAPPRRDPVTTAVTPPEQPRTEPEAAPSGPPSRGLVEPAIARYASAVGSRQIARIRDAYPGITTREVARWERFLGQHASVRARYELQDAPRVTGTTAEVLFTLTLSYPGASGEEVEMPLPLRAVLQWTGRDWSLREVLSLAGNGP